MLDTVYVFREARLDTSSQLQPSNPLLLQWAHHLPNLHLSREWKSPFLTSAYPLATKIAFLPWLHGTPVPSWRLLLSAGVESPQDILARNESDARSSTVHFSFGARSLQSMGIGTETCCFWSSFSMMFCFSSYVLTSASSSQFSLPPLLSLSRRHSPLVLPSHHGSSTLGDFLK